MSIKQDRVSGRIRTILSELLLREVADPRLHYITITDVELDPELQYAKVYVNALGDEDRQADVMQGLEHARGFLRREVGKRVRLRKTPELEFRWDHTLERSERINQLIASLDIPPAEETPEEDTDDYEG
ncbi:MAG TPA: 30S ribosome-binding factor RbfA [Oceanobacillus sp.]|nr:30S ribosome-binding factor RbfA [Oceanobacillus sp.]